MTTPPITSPIPGLEVRSVDNTGRFFYEATVRRVREVSQYNPEQFNLDGLTGYWQVAQDGTTPVVVGTWYKLALTTKPKPPGPRTNPGSMYQDIRKAVLAEDGEIPVQQPGANGEGQQIDSQSDYRRSKEEMRWTEAYHMASRVATAVQTSEASVQDWEASLVGWAGWFYNELADADKPNDQQPEEPATEQPEPDLPF